MVAGDGQRKKRTSQRFGQNPESLPRASCDTECVTGRRVRAAANRDGMLWNHSKTVFDNVRICPKVQHLDEACITSDLILILRNTKRVSRMPLKQLDSIYTRFELQ